jgi:flagellar hook-associated protein 3 FlgL
MQISTKLFNQQTLERLSELHSEIQNRQARIATGKNLLHASDDPIAAANISVAKEQKQELARYLDNIDRAKNKLDLSEGAMKHTVTILTRIYELTIQAENDVNSPADRDAIKMEITQLKESMLDVVNSEDASGQALFAGYKVNSNAFEKDVDGTIQYMGDRGQNYLKIAENMTLATGIDGATAFLRVPSENDHKSVFRVIEAIEDGFEDGDFPDIAITDLQRGIEHFTLQQTYIGAQINKANIQEEALQRRQIIMSENLSQLEDADLTKLVTELQTMLVNRDAATQAFAKIGQQSLFDFLR